MTEIMPVPRNSHITVLRPPSISAARFDISSNRRQIRLNYDLMCVKIDLRFFNKQRKAI